MKLFYLILAVIILNDQDKIYIDIILEYMMCTIDKYQNQILNIKRSHFYSKFDVEDYYDMLIAQVRLETCLETFAIIRDFLNFM